MPQTIIPKNWSWMVLWWPTRPPRTNTKRRCPFHDRGLECKSRKSRDTQSNRHTHGRKRKRTKDLLMKVKEVNGKVGLNLNIQKTLVHCVGDAIHPSHPLSSLFLHSVFPSIRVFSLCIRWPKYWSFNINISPSNEHLGLISFRMDCLDLLVVQGTLKVFSNTTVQKHQFFGTQLSL